MLHDACVWLCEDGIIVVRLGDAGDFAESAAGVPHLLISRNFLSHEYSTITQLPRHSSTFLSECVLNSAMVCLIHTIPFDCLLHGSQSDLPQANLPNLRRLFVDARTEAEESSYSRTAVWTVSSTNGANGTEKKLVL